MARLFITKGAGIGRDRVVAEECVLGRAADVDLVVEDLGASRRHARVGKEGDVFVVRDLGSRNGTFVNGQRVQAASLNDGDMIRLGGTEIVFRLADDAPAPVVATVETPKAMISAANVPGPTLVPAPRPAAAPAPAAGVARPAAAPAAAPAARPAAAPASKPAEPSLPKKPLPNVVPTKKRRGVF